MKLKLIFAITLIWTALMTIGQIAFGEPLKTYNIVINGIVGVLFAVVFIALLQRSKKSAKNGTQ